MLPVIGIMLTVFVVKRFLGGLLKKELHKFYMQLQKKQVLFQKNKCMPKL